LSKSQKRARNVRTKIVKDGRLLQKTGVRDLFRRTALLAAAVCVGLSSVSSPARAADELVAGFRESGLVSLTFAGTQLLKKGQPRLRHVFWESGDVDDVPGSAQPTTSFDLRSLTLVQTWTQGQIACVYRESTDRLNIQITFTNRGDRRIRGLDMNVLDLAFPITPGGPGWNNDLHTTSDAVDDVAAIIAQYGSASLAAVGTDLDSEFRLQLEKDFETVNPGYNLMVGTLSKSTSDFVHVDGCRLDPGQAVRFQISLRFGPSKAGLADLAGDVFAKFRQRFPRVLNWPDRRPITMLMLASSAAEHHSSTNPRGWLNDPRVDVTTPDGRDAFKNQMLQQRAQRCVDQCELRGAQGVIVWDVEGEEYPPLVFVGDPRKLPQLAPEMDAIATDVFKVFSDAGLKTGICIRPSRIAKQKGETPWRHDFMGFDPVAEMAGKIAYAKRRWGCTLFYVDTNVTLALASRGPGKKDEVQNWFVRADQMRRLAQRFPDVLIIPEFQYTGYYSHLSGYRELRGGIASTSERDRLAYPGAFSVINVADGPIVERRADLLAGVRRGDILMFRGWFGTRDGALVQGIYEEARR
jgi:hypothetical protein